MSDDIISYAFGFTPPKGKEYFTEKDIKNIGKSGICLELLFQRGCLVAFILFLNTFL